LPGRKRCKIYPPGKKHFMDFPFFSSFKVFRSLSLIHTLPPQGIISPACHGIAPGFKLPPVKIRRNFFFLKYYYSGVKSYRLFKLQVYSKCAPQKACHDRVDFFYSALKRKFSKKKTYFIRKSIGKEGA